jgi:hypothetical protein
MKTLSDVVSTVCGWVDATGEAPWREWQRARMLGAVPPQPTPLFRVVAMQEGSLDVLHTQSGAVFRISLELVREGL